MAKTGKHNKIMNHMKTTYLILTGWLCMLLPAALLTSCGETEDLPEPTEETSTLKLEKEQIRVVVGSNATIEILEGNNDYQVFSLNEEIASVVLSGNTLTVEALTMGETSVILSDGSSQYRSLNIISYYDEIILEREELKITVPVGNSKTSRIAILKGNGDYTVESSDPELLTATISGSDLVLELSKEGTATLTLTDRFGITATIPVTVTITDKPYDEFELKKIMETEMNSFMFNDQLIENATTYYTIVNGMENGQHLYGWDYYNFYYLKIYFSGDSEVGKKEDASLIYSYSSTSFNVQVIDLEIIKNDGEKIWTIFSFLQNERLYYGYFIQEVNP